MKNNYSYNDTRKLLNQKIRADTWAKKYKQDLADYEKTKLDNDDLKRVNNELNIMQTRTLEKVIYLGNENRNLKDKIKKLSINNSAIN